MKTGQTTYIYRYHRTHVERGLVLSTETEEIEHGSRLGSEGFLRELSIHGRDPY